MKTITIKRLVNQSNLQHFVRCLSTCSTGFESHPEYPPDISVYSKCHVGGRHPLSHQCSKYKTLDVERKKRTINIQVTTAQNLTAQKITISWRLNFPRPHTILSYRVLPSPLVPTLVQGKKLQSQCPHEVQSGMEVKHSFV